MTEMPNAEKWNEVGTRVMHRISGLEGYVQANKITNSADVSMVDVQFWNPNVSDYVTAMCIKEELLVLP